ncbi:alanine--tRNA ligase [Nanoarchaeota archaeon]
MKTDKELKKDFKAKASKEPDKYYPTSVLKEKGFFRNKCEKCKKFFWDTDKNRKVCGDSECVGGFSFIGDTPATLKTDYVGLWKAFADMFEKKGYKVVNRYPVIARWNPTTFFTNASIAAFQPFVISGEVEPPAKELVIPQFSIRFPDLDNVGITGSHCTGFVMIGQHAFVPPKDWDQAKYFTDIYEWLTEGMGIPKEEVTFHEDAWAGGGNFGPCMEYFSRGCEIGNQVYMMFEQTEKGNKELDIKVLDMGMGQERAAWFLNAHGQIYETIFPTVCKKLKELTKIKYNEKLMDKYVHYAPMLNLDEVDDINKAWERVAEKLEMPVDNLKAEVQPLAALYSIAEHTRTLLFSIADGGLPSNVGGGYNLRIIFRRIMSFIDKYGWDIDLKEVCKWHAEYLKPQYPELIGTIEGVGKILDIEKEKYYESKKKAENVLKNVLKSDVNQEKLIELYDSQGITPEHVQEEAEKQGIKINVPDNFYGLVSERHEQVEQKTATKKEVDVDVAGVEGTKALYFDNFRLTEFDAIVKKVNKDHIILDQTAFYPTSGGQLHDTGSLNGKEVKDVFKQGEFIVHTVPKNGFKEGDKIKGQIDFDRRLQLTQHHTGAHIINGSARKVLGEHVWQAGASKSLKKARLDITHYDNLSKEEIEQIETVCNETIKENLPVYSEFMKRNLAEAEYGFRLYQGGAVPGKQIRVINIPGFDVEACGGTHLKATGEAKEIKILRTTKIQDGVVRIEFTAGKATDAVDKKEGDILGKCTELLNCNPKQVPGRVKELFDKWKQVVKKKKEIESKELTSTEEYTGETENILFETSKILKTQVEHITKTIERFLRELKSS